MFDLPEAKRVCREDLHESDASIESDDEQNIALRAQLEARLAQSLQFDLVSALPKDQSQPAKTLDGNEIITEDDGKVVEPEGYEFCLFGGAGAGAGPTKVILENESDEEGEGGLMQGRPLSFYSAQRASGRLRDEYRFAGVTGEDILERSSRRLWGMEYPWRVTHITAVKKPGENVSVSQENEESKSRKRPGKKRRIALRVKERATTEKKEAAAKQAAVKEEHIKEKKKRLNRLKKLRKRAKDKEKKQSGQVAGEEESAGGSDGDSS